MATWGRFALKLSTNFHNVSIAKSLLVPCELTGCSVMRLNYNFLLFKINFIIFLNYFDLLMLKIKLMCFFFLDLEYSLRSLKI